MDDRFINKFITKVKNMFTKKNSSYLNISDYAFSMEELESINKKNKQKIQELKQDVIEAKKNNYDSNKTDEVLSRASNNVSISDDEEEILPLEENESIEDLIVNAIETDDSSGDDSLSDEVVNEPKNSFINLSDEHKKIVMDKWEKIDYAKIDRDIISGKDLLNHNYTITYVDEASRFIQYIRREYEVVICYLIGFNNEKQGIYDRTYFADSLDLEWKYLSNYIKMLEKIRKNR